MGIPQHTRPQQGVTVNTVEKEVSEVQHVVEEDKRQEVDEVEQVADEVKLKVEQKQQKGEELVAGAEEKSEQEKQRLTIMTGLIDEAASKGQNTLMEKTSREVAKVIGTLLLLMLGREGAIGVGRGESCQVVLLHNSAGDSFFSHLTQRLLRYVPLYKFISCCVRSPTIIK